MRFLADFHIHSRFSRATSRDLDLPHLQVEAQRKGVTVVGTGDFTHPGWFAELREQLIPAEEGLYRLRDDLARAAEAEVPPSCRRPVRFLLSVEISNIYKRGDAVRKVHNLVLVPDFDAAARLRARLERIGNLTSDGRPILGLDSRDLLEMTRQSGERNVFIPAHIWTPWFSVLGAKSGFDSVEEAFGDLAGEIFALETGLSSDPPMNWRLSALDRFSLVSNSDAHSPGKLAREANVFDVELSYDAVMDALRTRDPAHFLGTVEFFPQEGKYHADGCRRCAFRCLPRETLEHGGRCPGCGKRITVGVLHRVEALADRSDGYRPRRAPPFRSLVPLEEILAQVYGVGGGTRTVRRTADALVASLGPELEILQHVPLEEIERTGGAVIAESVRRVRAGEVEIAAGYDGEFGVIRIFRDDERDRLGGQKGLFPAASEVRAVAGEPEEPVKPRAARGAAGPGAARATVRRTKRVAEPEGEEAGADASQAVAVPPAERHARWPPAAGAAAASAQHVREKPALWETLPLFTATGMEDLNAEQRLAVERGPGALLVLAGPGTGKTRVLVHRIAWLINVLGVEPGTILALTFTNRAADEVRDRLGRLIRAEQVRRVAVRTLHAHGLAIVRAEAARLGLPQPVRVIGEAERLARMAALIGAERAERAVLAVSRLKTRAEDGADEAPELLALAREYDARLHADGLVDFDDLVRLPARFLASRPEIAQRWRRAFVWVLVDEFQDLDAAQYDLLKQVAPPGSNVTAVGDPDQAIYGFRGASPEFVERFVEEYSPAVVHLTCNYRSTPTILRAAAHVVAGPQARPMRAVVAGGVRLLLREAPTAAAEAEAVVHDIERLVGGTSLFSLDSGRVVDEEPEVRAFSEIAVLFRVRQVAYPLMEALERSGIPYQQAEARPLLADPIVAAIVQRAGGAPPGTTPAAALREAVEALAAEALRGALPFARGPGLVEGEPSVERGAVRGRPVGAGGRDTGWAEEIRRIGARLAPIAERASDLAWLTAELALRADPDLLDPRAERVALLTLHAAKGLEFPVVFIIGCEEGLVPYQPPAGEPAPLEEERRLLYVGMTRARRILVLSRARRRTLFGRTSEAQPSRFLASLSEALLRRVAAEALGTRPGAQQLRLL